jgi:hypothetical protein
MANKVVDATQNDWHRFEGIWILWIQNVLRFCGFDQSFLDGNQVSPFVTNCCLLFVQLRPKLIRRGRESVPRDGGFPGDQVFTSAKAIS